METPLNEKQRNSAIVKFILVCLVSLLFLVYHILISIDAYHADYSTVNVTSESVAPVVE
jgi:hypothetical protein